MALRVTGTSLSHSSQLDGTRARRARQPPGASLEPAWELRRRGRCRRNRTRRTETTEQTVDRNSKLFPGMIFIGAQELCYEESGSGPGLAHWQKGLLNIGSEAD